MGALNCLLSLLSILGIRMLRAGMNKTVADENVASSRHGVWLLITTAVATSLDARSVGVSLAFQGINIVLTAILIGLATTLMVTIGMLLGCFLGAAITRWAEVMGGLPLIGPAAPVK